MAVKVMQGITRYIGTAAEIAAYDISKANIGSTFFESDTGILKIVNESGVLVNAPSESSTVSLSGSIVETPTVATAGVASGVALAANANRKYARFQNDSANTIYLKVGAAAVLNQGIRLNANGGSYEMSAANGNLDLRVVNCITSVAAQNLLVGEG